MATITKKDLIDRIAKRLKFKRGDVQSVMQLFLDEVSNELGKGNRLEFRDFGVFEVTVRSARMAQNPRTLDPVEVPERRAVRFKAGRRMKMAVDGEEPAKTSMDPKQNGRHQSVEVKLKKKQKKREPVR